MLPQSYKFSHGLCLDCLLQVLLVVNQRYQVTPFRSIHWDDSVSTLVRGSKVIEYTKYLTRSVKQDAEEVGIRIEDNWGVKRVNSLYTMVSERFNIKINKRFD